LRANSDGILEVEQVHNLGHLSGRKAWLFAFGNPETLPGAAEHLD
jgi:hypothetical protein